MLRVNRGAIMGSHCRCRYGFIRSGFYQSCHSSCVAFRIARHFTFLFLIKKTVSKKIALFSSLVALTFGLGFILHRQTLVQTTLLAEQDFISRTSSQARIFDEFFPKVGYFSDSLRKT
ncbi:MAG: hypothetical protein R2864_05000 [Syntrophotaleaceae bacterium]